MVKALGGHGIGNYVKEFALGLAERATPYELFYLVDPALPVEHPLRALPHRDCKIPFLHPLEPFTLGKEIAKYKPSLYHTPSFASLWSYPCPHIQTVHDLNHLHFGSVPQRLYYAWLLLPSLRKAKRVVTVSESSQKEIAAWLKSQGAEREIAVAENAIVPVPGTPAAGILDKCGLTAGNYYFALSNKKPFKNLPLLKRAYRHAAGQAQLPPLVISTKGESGGGIIHTGPLLDQELAPLRAGARALFFPSLYEGFGRPPLEAALAGVVPVVSEIAPHREVMRGVKEAIFLPPHQLDAWADAFLHPPAAGVSEHSKEWIRNKYSLENLVTKMAAIYERALAD
jgi:glycosyltransferase involved in cell wall biosynthesis